jgi:hypothetical protein
MFAELWSRTENPKAMLSRRSCWEQRIVLEDHAAASLLDRHPLDALAADGDAATVG